MRVFPLPDVRESFPEPLLPTIATVDAENFYRFDPDLGPLISVTTQPAKVPLVCRVAMRVAGKGEAEYYPFSPGDEVVVLVPRGDRKAGGVIVGRLCNGVDRFPQSVAGQDATANKLAFSRAIAPIVEEQSAPIVSRDAKTGAFISIGSTGTVTLRDGEGSALQVSADVIGAQSSDGTSLAQLDLGGGRFTVQAKDALLVLASSSADPERSAIVVPGTLSISTSTNPAAEHAISTEAVLNLIANVLNALGLQLAALGPVPLTGASLGALLVKPASETTFLPLGVTAAASGPFAALNPVVAAAIVAAFAGATQKPPATPATGQLQPGIGCVGSLIG